MGRATTQNDPWTVCWRRSTGRSQPYGDLHGDLRLPVVVAQVRDLDAGVLPAGWHRLGPEWPVCLDALGSRRRASCRHPTVPVCLVPPHVQRPALGPAAASERQSAGAVDCGGLARAAAVALAPDHVRVSRPLSGDPAHGPTLAGRRHGLAGRARPAATQALAGRGAQAPQLWTVLTPDAWATWGRLWRGWGRTAAGAGRTGSGLAGSAVAGWLPPHRR